MNYRKPAVAGQFYPGNGDTLTGTLSELFRQAASALPEEKRHVSGLIAPHAGYVFSGLQAAKAYHYILQKPYKLVCIISPSHRDYFQGISLFPGKAYSTPLGDCPVDEKAREIALQSEGVFAGMEGHRAEHALEVQLPFVQHALGDIPILPMVMGDQGEETVLQAAQCLYTLHQTYRDDVLFIASSDLSHFHTAQTAERMDRNFIGLLEKGEAKSILEALRLGSVEACGGGPIAAVLQGLGKERHEVRVLGYSHSGQVIGDNNSVVGYTSALILKKEKDTP